MDSAAALRYGRQIALPDVGPDGQERILRSRVLIVGDDRAAETAALYLRAAGVGTVTMVHELPSDGEGWLALLTDVTLVVRSGFDDDALAGAAARHGIPVVVVRANFAALDMVSFPKRPPAPDAPFATSIPALTPTDKGAPAVLAGTLAAAEALHAIVRAGSRADTDDDGPLPIRHLRLPLDGGEPLAQVVGAR
jgi:hypothetical protein